LIKLQIDNSIEKLSDNERVLACLNIRDSNPENKHNPLSR